MFARDYTRLDVRVMESALQYGKEGKKKVEG